MRDFDADLGLFGDIDRSPVASKSRTPRSGRKTSKSRSKSKNIRKSEFIELR